LIALEEKVLAKKPYKLRHYSLKMASGATPTIVEVSKYYADKETGVPFIRVQNLNETGLLSLDDLKYINHETHENYLKRSQVHEDDLLVKITGVGRMAVAGVPPKGFEGNINQHIVVVKTEDRETSEVLAAYLNSDVGEKLASRRSTGGTRPALDYPALKSIPIIYEPRLIELATNARERKYQKEQQADDLLKSIDKFLLEQLGIVIEEPQNSIEDRIFKTQWQKVIGNRYDPKKYSINTSSLYKAIEASIFSRKSLKSLLIQKVSGDWGLEVTENFDEHLYKKCLVIRATEFDNKYNLQLDNSRAKFRLINKFKLSDLDIRETDFLLEKSGGSIDQPVGRIALLDNEILGHGTIAFSNFIHKFRVNTTAIEPEYLFSYLKMIHNVKLTDTMQSQTNGIRNLILNEYWNQSIPLPSLNQQRVIASEVSRRRKEARTIELSAQVEFDKAKKEIENLILQ
jgi:hypothetical protein